VWAAINEAFTTSYKFCPKKPEQVAAAFEKVEAPRGSRVWAWTELHLGVLDYYRQQCSKAREHFRQVAEAMEQGPEKTLAMMNAGQCNEALHDREEAVRAYRIVMSLRAQPRPSGV
jgi:hypothetical protein